MSRRVFWILFGPLAALLVLVAAYSLEWRMLVDSPILVYEGFLMSAFGRVPYRDFFDMNMPGTHLIHWLLVTVAGKSDLAFRWVEILWLGSVLGVTWTILRRISTQVATASVIAFGLAHLAYGPYYGLQRELLLLLPVSLSILALILPLRAGPAALRRPVARTFLASFLVGLAATIKPHGTLSLPLIVLFQWRGGSGGGAGSGASQDRNGGSESEDSGRDEASAGTGSSAGGADSGREDRRSGSLIAHVVAAMAGFLVPVAGIFFYLVLTGALGPFLDIAFGYWPLYTHLTVSHQTIAGIDRFIYMVRGFSRFGTHGLWLMPAALGLSIGLYQSTLSRAQKRLVLLLAGHGLVYAIYPLFAGQFWVYHYLPFMYFMILLGGLCLAPAASRLPRGQRAIAVGALMLAILCRAHPPLEFITQVAAGEIIEPRLERVDEMAGFLRSRLRPGDQVQPLDWTGGAVQAMLATGAELATPFVYDFHFYHHVSKPYTQRLRGRFIESMEGARPRFVIEVEEEKPWPWGFDTTREFPELQRILTLRYRPVFRGSGYVIHERAGDR